MESVGLQVWHGALLLSDFIMHTRFNFMNKNVLELGSGTGFVGIVAAMYCDHITCTDLNDAGILETISRNFELNKKLLKAKFRIQKFDFSKEWTLDVRNLICKADIILASELVYDNDITDHLVNTLVMILRTKPQIKIYFTIEKRYIFSILNLQVEAKYYNYFFEQLEKMTQDNSRWHLARIFDIPQYFYEYYRNKEIELWQIFVD